MPEFVSRTGMAFMVLILAGFLLANNILIMSALIPLCLLAFGYFIKTPQDVIIKKSISTTRIMVGQHLDVTLKVAVKSGVGHIEVCDIVPANFELVRGSNYFAVWKGPQEKVIDLKYTIRSTVSGTYPIKPTVWKSKHPICNYFVSDECDSDITVEVTPRLLELRKVRGMSSVNKVPMPQGAISSMGMTTNEFKEIRLYSPGDSFKTINWKVTSRNLLRGNTWPVVNEYEKEGKKAVWIFLDTSRTMNFGSNIKNIKEYSIEVVNALSDYYLKQNCSVSFITYGNRRAFLHSGTGRTQYHKILKELLRLKENKGESFSTKGNIAYLSDVVFSSRKYFAGLRPLFVVVTRFCTNNCDEVQKGIKELSKYTARNGIMPSIMVVNIAGYGLMAENRSEELASNLLDSMNKVISKEIRRECIWVDWNPEKESFTGALLKQVVVGK